MNPEFDESEIEYRSQDEEDRVKELAAAKQSHYLQHQGSISVLEKLDREHLNKIRTEAIRSTANALNFLDKELAR
ncbi:MAG: hypothetical protein COA78_11185 [Blastopirellula sp.]|nr:MAG: hypothetical protein COA78_11185 [Blastopirellula sp.]